MNPNAPPLPNRFASLHPKRHPGDAARLPAPVIAAPSYVWPGTLAENCTRLAGRVDEAGLLFFETQSCLAYTGRDLPRSLAELDLRFHVHLPLDLPWDEGHLAAWTVVSALLDKCAFLSPWAAVLHPPPAMVCPGRKNPLSTPLYATLLDNFLRLWGEDRPFVRPLVENTRENDLAALWPVIQAQGAGICLDLGHLLAFSQETDKLPGIWPRVGMVHLSAPGPRGEHWSLRRLDRAGQKRMNAILSRLRADAVVMLEVFTPRDLRESLAFIREWSATT